MFQFQTGAIKSYWDEAYNYTLMTFQFQTGAIKSRNFAHLTKNTHFGFNSKLVRLKVEWYDRNFHNNMA